MPSVFSFLLFLYLVADYVSNTAAFMPLPTGKSRSLVVLNECEKSGSRREFLFGAAMAQSCALVLSYPGPVGATNDLDLTSQMFNTDGSLKEGVESAAKFRNVDIEWSVPTASDNGSQGGAAAVNVDGTTTTKNTVSTGVVVEEGNNNKITVSYRLPEKWGKRDGEDYYDKGEQVKACNHIYVYRSPNKATKDQLQKATTTAVAKALDVIDELNVLTSADLLSGRTEKKKNDLVYYSFDMAVAPTTCESSPENLGLGFCPYTSIYLLSATVVDDFLYVFALECDKSEWKISSSDLKAVRSSFEVNV